MKYAGPWAKAAASVAVCGIGAYSMSLTGGVHGIGWVMAGLLIVWGGG